MYCRKLSGDKTGKSLWPKCYSMVEKDNLYKYFSTTDQNEDQAGDIGHPPQVMVRQNRRRNKCKISPCILLVVEMLTILVVGFSAYLVGLYQGKVQMEKNSLR